MEVPPGRRDLLYEDITMSGVAPEDVLNVQAELRRQGQAHDVLYKAVIGVLEAHQLLRRELRQTDSLSYQSPDELQRIRAAVSQFRILPEAEQQKRLALRHGVAKLEVVAGDYAAAVGDFQAVGGWSSDDKPKAEAYANAFTAALEAADYVNALAAFKEAAQRDAERFCTFPIKDFELQRVGGADAFGPVFHCFHRSSASAVLVRPLRTDDLDRSADDYLVRAREYAARDFPATLKIRNAEYVRPEIKAKPYLVMDQFFGLPLDEHLEKYGPLPPKDFLTVVQMAAEGLQALHYRNLVHGAVRPGNFLLYKDEETGWKVRLANFGLVFKPTVLQALPRNATPQTLTVRSATIVRALEYAAPEQVGRLAGVYPGAYSDIYSFGKTCCYALFRTPNPPPQFWQSVPPPVAELLLHCLQEVPERRPPDFGAVLKRLAQIKTPGSPRTAGRPVVVPTVTAAVVPQPVYPAAVGPRAAPPTALTAAVPGPGLGAPPVPRPMPAADRRAPIWPWVVGGVGLLAVIGVVIVSLLIVLVFNKPTPPPQQRPAEADNRPPAVRPPVQQRPNTRPPAVAQESPDELHLLTGHQASVTSVAFSPNGQRILSGDADGAIYLWDVENRRIAQRYLGLRSTITSLAFAPDGQSALSGSLDRSVIVWAAEDGERKQKFTGHTDAVLAVAFAADGRRAFSFDRGGSLWAWDVKTGDQQYHVTPEGARLIAFSADGRWAVTAGPSHVMCLIDLDNGREENRWMSPPEIDFTCLAMSPDGRKAFSAGSDKTLREWDVRTGRTARSISGAGVGEIVSLAYSPSGQRLLHGDTNGDVRLRELDTGTELKRFTGHRFRVTSVAFSPDGRRAVSAGYDRTVRVWKLPF
jgi:serine/threonine protein kinase